MSVTVIGSPADRAMVYGSDIEIFGHRPVTAGADWWLAGGAACIWAAYQPKGSANFAASRLDLSGNGNNAGVGVFAPTWDAVNGWKFAINQYLTTTFVPQNDQSQSLIIQFTNKQDGVTYQYFAGCGLPPTQYFGIREYTDATNNCGYANGATGGLLNVAPKLLAGNLAVAGNAGYRNGAPEPGAIGAYTGAIVVPLWIGCMNNGGMPIGHLTGYIQALAIYDCTLTAPQVLAVATAMAAL